MAKNLTRFGQFLLVFDEWTTLKFEHWLRKPFVRLRLSHACKVCNFPPDTKTGNSEPLHANRCSVMLSVWNVPSLISEIT